MARPRLIVLSLLGLWACDSAPARVSKPPPLPPLPALSAPAPAEAVPAEPAAEQQSPVEAHGPARERRKEVPGTREPPAARAAKLAPPEAKTSGKPAPAKVQGTQRDPLPPVAANKPATASTSPLPPSQQPQIIATNLKPAAVGKVSVPKTVHVAIDVPSGLQADLDHDPRMQPWVNQVVATIDRCYSGEAKSKAAGTIEVLVTMHENERPDADIKQLPPALSPLVACATGGLMRTKMPLFTGKEGSRYTVRLRFSP